MPAYVALLRAINVGGRRMAMAELTAMLHGIGLQDARTILQSGNAVFTSTIGIAALAPLLEAETQARFGFHTDYLLRSGAEWNAIMAGNPFTAEAAADPARLVVMPLKHTPTPQAVAALQAAIAGPERIAVDGATLYAVYPEGQGNSKLTINLIERKLATKGTARNWNTVRKLQIIPPNR
jgi:uncharacterized protein (DUF1697 family)